MWPPDPDSSGGLAHHFMPFYTYIIESFTTGKWYYGHTHDIDTRVKNHNCGKSNYTKSKGPWKLIFLRTFETKAEAIKFEKYLKKSRNKSYILREFQEYFIRDVAQPG
ncbi:MAG: GIY-YIG nuclease family protein [Fulvivirga sp.]|nr:GIY-YIG nuclease family protein [Fulvivirga sp.]